MDALSVITVISNPVTKCFFLALIVSVGVIDCFSQNNKYDPHSDTITIGNTKVPTHFSFKFDTICIELYLDETRLAILPTNLKQFIDSRRISKTEQVAETLSDGRNLLRIQMFIVTKRKDRP